MQDTTYVGCQLGVEACPLPDGSMGRAIVIVDPGSQGIWRYPMTMEQAKTVAAALDAPEGIQVPGGADIARFNGKGPHQ